MVSIIKFLLSCFLFMHASCTNETKNVEPSNFNRSIANVIGDSVRVLCWILTTADHHSTRAVHLRNTWGKRCDTLLFMSTIEDPNLPSIALPLGESTHRWNKVKDAFKYIYKHHYGDADWFMKVDDDTYIIVENLKYLLYGLNSSEPLYLGNQMKKVKPAVKSRNKQSMSEHIYMSGGSGYILSKEALRRFVEVAFFNPAMCQQEFDGKYADLEMGMCMKALKIPPVDTRDDKGRERFMGIHPQHMLNPTFNPDFEWYWRASVHNISLGMECCSINPVSFHQIKPAEMYFLELLLYHTRPFGVRYVSDIREISFENSTKIT